MNDNIKTIAKAISELTKDDLRALADLNNYKVTVFGSKSEWLDEEPIPDDSFVRTQKSVNFQLLDRIAISFKWLSRQDFVELNSLLDPEGIKFLMIEHHTTYHCPTEYT